MKTYITLFLLSATIAVLVAQAQSAQPWSYAGELQIGRAYHSATLLLNGKVLVVGGGNEESLDSAELFDPNTQTFTQTGRLKQARRVHTATLLPNGKVLVTGGIINDSRAIASAELYDPASGTWTETGALNAARALHTATLLPDGKVLVAGGFGGPDVQAVESAELYDVETGRWTFTPQKLNVARWLHHAVLLPDGKVLIVAGFDTNHSIRAEIYDPVTGKWSNTGDLNFERANFTATLLPDGRVLAVGGGSPATFNAEVFNPLSGVWTLTASPRDGRYNHKAVSLGNGKVLVTGGTGATALNTSEIYDPAAAVPEPAVNRWSVTENLNTGRFWHTATLLKHGQVLVAGGTQNGSPPTFFKSAELFNPFLSDPNQIVTVSASSYAVAAVAPGSIATAFGTQLATLTQAATAQPLPTELAGTQVRIKDRSSATRLAPLFFVSPNQINFLLPPDTLPGTATVIVTNGNGLVRTGSLAITPTAPGLFSANADGAGPAAAVLLRIKADGSRVFEAVVRFDPNQNKFVTSPIEFDAASEQLFLMLYGTGIRGRSSTAALICYLGGIRAEVTGAQAQGDFAGLDQINVSLPRMLAGRGELDVILTVDGQIANPLKLNFK